MTSSSFSPWIVKSLMAAGALPFIALAFSALFVPMMLIVTWYGGLVYGAVIVSFLAGVHWALALTQPIPRANTLLIVSNAVALWAWVAVFLMFSSGAVEMLIAAFVAQLAIDLRWPGLPYASWYRQWRAGITALVCSCLLVAFFASAG